MLSCYFQEKQRSFTSGDFWVLPRWQVTHFQFLLVFQDGGHVKFPTLGQRLNVKIPTQGKAHSVNFPWVARPPPPPTLGLNIDRCINTLNSGSGGPGFTPCLSGCFLKEGTYSTLSLFTKYGPLPFFLQV